MSLVCLLQVSLHANAIAYMRTRGHSVDCFEDECHLKTELNYLAQGHIHFSDCTGFLDYGQNILLCKYSIHYKQVLRTFNAVGLRQ